MKKVFITIVALVGAQIAFAQTVAQYKLLECKGEIPKEFLQTSTSKYKKEKEKIKSKEESRKTKRILQDYSLESNFVLDKLMQSGFVLFNDDVSLYLNDVAKKVLTKDDEIFQKKIHVYTLRSAYVNAFATERGDIFVTLGLLSKLQNESQLAFILSHEISHVKEKHNTKSVLKADKIDKETTSRSASRSSRFDQKLLKKSMYSKELELEADSLAVSRFLGAGYDVKAIEAVMDILKTSEQPFTNDKFNYADIESGSYNFLEEYKDFTPEKAAVEEEDADDSKSTHPNIGTRKKQIKQVLQGVQIPTMAVTHQNAKFDQMKKRAQLELPMMHLHNGALAECVYVTNVMLQKAPSNLYLKKCLAKALYVHAKFKNNPKYTELILVDVSSGNLQTVYNFMEEMTGEETSALAANYIWRLYQSEKEDEEIAFMAKDIMYEMYRHMKALSDFEPKPSKEKRYWKTALYDYRNDEELKGFYAEAKERKEKFDSRKPPKKKRKTAALGIDKIVIVNPQYMQIDMRYGTDVKYIASEEGRFRFDEFIEIAADKSKLDYKILDVKKLAKNEIEAFNDIRYLNEWFSEQSDFAELNITPGYNQYKINEIAKRYGTDYFLWTGVISTQQKNNNFIALFPSLFFPPALPFAGYAALKPKFHMLYYSMLFDVKTGRKEVLSFDFYKRKDSDALMKSHIYDSFFQIKKKPKKRK